MKSRIITLLVISLLAVVTVNGQGNSKKNNPVGSWKFEAPYAPEGYTSGTIVIGQADQKPTATMSFTGSEYKLPGEKVVIAKDSLSFAIFLEGQDIKVSLKIETDSKMTGKAVYSEGVVPLTLTKNTTPEPETKK